MSKETFYFRHDYHARNDHKTAALISDHGATGYGIYWCIIEMLHEESEHKLPLEEYFYRSTAKQTSTSVEQVLNIVKDCLEVYKLFIAIDGFFHSPRVQRNILDREEIREKRSLAGKISAEKRKNSTSVQRRSTNKRKGKESKGKELSITPELSLEEKELLEISEDNKARWVKFKEWYNGFGFTVITKIENQLTPVQLAKLFEDYGATEIKDMLINMENYKSASKYTSVYLTLLKWLKKEAQAA